MTWWNDLLSLKYIAAWKDPVRMATTGALPAYTRVGNLYTANAVGAAPAVDGLTPAVGNAMLFWHGASGIDNGIVEWKALGSGSTKWSFERRWDADEDRDYLSGLSVRVAAGTAYAGAIFRLSTADPVRVNVTAQTYVADTNAMPAPGALGTILKSDGAGAWIVGALNLAVAASIMGILPVANGGVPTPANPADDGKVLTASAGVPGWTANTSPTMPANPGDNEKVAIAAAGNFVYAKVTTANIDAAAGIVGSQLSATAAIAAAQLAGGGAGNVLLGGAPNTWGQVTTTQIAAAAGILGSQLSATAGIVGTQLSASAAIAATQLAAGAAGTVLAGGASNSFTATPTVTSVLCGASTAAGATLAATALTWGKSVAAPGLTQTAKDDDTAPQNLTLTPQAPWATAMGVNRDPGNCIIALAAPTNGGTGEGSLRITRASTFVGQMGPYPTAPATYTGLWLIPGVAPTTANYTFLGSSTVTILNAPTQINLALAGAAQTILTTAVLQLAPPALQWVEGVAPLILQTARTTDSATNSLTIQAQSAWANSTGANVHGAHLLLRGGAEKGAAAGKKGGVRLQLNATAETMVEATEIAIGRRVVALGLGADLTATEIPANAGDRVVFVAEAATVPTAAPGSNGVTLYGTAGALGIWATAIAFNAGRAACSITQSALTAATGTGAALSISAQQATGNTNVTAGQLNLSGGAAPGTGIAVGGKVTINGGEAGGSGGTHTGGDVEIYAGPASGASGTRVGGKVLIHGGSGSTNGYVELQDQVSNPRMRVDNNGISFWTGTSPVTKQAFSGALSTVADAPAKAVLQSIVTALCGSGYNLCTDSTT